MQLFSLSSSHFFSTFKIKKHTLLGISLLITFLIFSFVVVDLEEKQSATLSLLSPSPPSSLLFAVSSVFSPLRRPKNDENPPRSTTLSVLTASPSSSLIFAVFVTMEIHHDRRLSCSERHLFRLLSSPHGNRRKISLSAIVERKKSPKRLVVDEAINDDNFVASLHPATMEKLKLFRCYTIIIKVVVVVVVVMNASDNSQL
ncbi:hypothetical protein DY000_02043417 [Brassica cretica]|uniref:Transmembrane protein n=1 Tax=Brassica cretica TaxID=69181 RepID=A0ABQ7B8E1_BRACR|nr:hypothetical protein DY000_02043417 [Brassica cretica]